MKIKEFFSKAGAYFADHRNRLVICLSMILTLLAISALVTAFIHQFRTGHTGLTISFVITF